MSTPYRAFKVWFPVLALAAFASALVAQIMPSEPGPPAGEAGPSLAWVMMAIGVVILAAGLLMVFWPKRRH